MTVVCVRCINGLLKIYQKRFIRLELVFFEVILILIDYAENVQNNNIIPIEYSKRFTVAPLKFNIAHISPYYAAGTSSIL